MFYDVNNDFHLCACVHVYLCVQMRSCQALAACIDVVMEVFLILSWCPAAPNSDTLMILWTFTCSSLELCHMVWKKIRCYSASFFPGHF